MVVQARFMHVLQCFLCGQYPRQPKDGRTVVFCAKCPRKACLSCQEKKVSKDRTDMVSFDVLRFSSLAVLLTCIPLRTFVLRICGIDTVGVAEPSLYESSHVHSCLCVWFSSFRSFLLENIFAASNPPARHRASSEML